jgi:hypothetical protein
MAIVELYGIRITDRVTVSHIGRDQFQVFFDGEYIDTAHSGPAAVGMAKAWLQQCDERRKEEAARLEKEEKREQEIGDRNFLYRVFPNLEPEDLDTLIEVLKRRMKADD